MKKRLSVLFSLVLVLSLFLTACAGGNNEGADGGEDTKEEVAQELRININTEPFSLHPGLANDTTSSSVLLQTFEGLTRITPEGKPEPAMAEKIDVSEDLTKYTFHLRDAKWTNGDPVTAHDFEYAWKWALDPKNESQYAYQLYYVKGAEAFNTGKGSADEVGVKAIDDKTLEVTLENPTPYFLELTAFYTYFPVNKKIAEANEKWYTDAGENYVSNGPFKMVEWSHNDKIVLEKNADYWDAETVKLEKIEMFMINDPNTELSMFQNGEIDWAGSPTGNLPIEALPQLKDQGVLTIQPIAGTYWYKFNTENEFLKSKNLRKALAYAIDRKSLVEQVTQGGEVPAMAAVPPTMFPENEQGYFEDNNVEEAKKLLDEALKELGLNSADEIKLTLSYNTLESHAKIAQAIQDMWSKNLGINVELDNAEWNVYIDKLHQGDYDIGRMGWLGDFNDAINFLELYRDKDGGNNDTRWEHPEFKKLLIDSQKESDPEKRIEMLKKAEEILMDEMPVAPIYFYTNKWVKKDNLKDVYVSGLGDVQFKWAYFE